VSEGGGRCTKLFISSSGVLGHNEDEVIGDESGSADAAASRQELPPTRSVGARDTLAAKSRVNKRASGSDSAVASLVLTERALPTPDADEAEHVSSMESVVRQALRSKDLQLLDKILSERDHSIIERTVTKLTVTEAMQLLTEVIERIHRTPGRVYQLEGWLIRLLRLNAGYFMSLPRSREVLEPLYRHISVRLNTHSSIIRVQGRVEGMLAQAAYRASLKAANSQILADSGKALLEHVEGQQTV